MSTRHLHRASRCCGRCATGRASSSRWSSRSSCTSCSRGPNKDNHNFGGTAAHPTGLFAPQYYMVGLLAFGAMVAVLSGGARIAAERTVGWNRQLRLTPLSAAQLPPHQDPDRLPDGRRSASCCSTPPGISLGVRLPFGALARDDRAGPGRADPVRRAGHRARATCSTTTRWARRWAAASSLFAFLGGTWFPITGGGLFVAVLPAAAVLLAGAGRPRRARRRQPVGRQGLGWSIAVWSVGVRRVRDVGLPARHRAGLIGLACGTMTDRQPGEVRATPSLDEAPRMWGAGWRRYFFPAFWLVYLGQTVDGVSEALARRRRGGRATSSSSRSPRVLPRRAADGLGQPAAAAVLVAVRRRDRAHRRRDASSPARTRWCSASTSRCSPSPSRGRWRVPLVAVLDGRAPGSSAALRPGVGRRRSTGTAR